MSIENFERWCQQLQQLTLAKRWRSLVVLVGDEKWTKQKLEISLSQLLSSQSVSEKSCNHGLVFGDIEILHADSQLNSLSDAQIHSQLTKVNRKTYAQYLGTEQNVIVFKPEQEISAEADNFMAEVNLDIDAFAALSGTIVAGGILLLLLTPEQVNQANISDHNDYFFQRFLRQLTGENCYFISQAQSNLPALTVDEPAQDKSLTLNSEAGVKATQANQATQASITDLPYGSVTQEQAAAVEAMLKVLSGHRDRPLVLTADRGRGKSSALALAACHMLSQARQPLKIIITAPSKQALQVFFEQVQQQLPAAKVSNQGIEHAMGTISFYPIDVILKERPKANLVMVDEAAALPVYLLQQLLSHYHRLIFATTIHGYEGAGRGFSLKFHQVLQQTMPNFRKMHINQAIRWASDDPLEKFVFNSCLLNAQLPQLDSEALAINTLDPANKSQSASLLEQQNSLLLELISPKSLLDNEALLQQVFAVLVTAHYQTSPSDLTLLLNNPAISLFVLKHNNDILGVALLMREGHVDQQLVKLVNDSQRRLRDQFLPQSLLTHCGIKSSFNYSYQRVMRIAIHPQIQAKGLGQVFLQQIEYQVAQQGTDFIGASFGANPALVNFWQQTGFSIARIGFTKDKASGEHSCLVVKPLTTSAEALNKAISTEFYQQFSYWLTDEFKHLPAKLVWQVLHGDLASKTSILNGSDAQSVSDFISGQRQFSSCVYGLHQWLSQHCTQSFDAEVLPVIARILQKNSIEDVCQQYGFSGKKALNQHMINYIAKYQTVLQQ